jgi:alpha/beta superfamily hydrolase
MSPKAEVKILEGADHYFYGVLDELGESVATFISGSAGD